MRILLVEDDGWWAGHRRWLWPRGGLTWRAAGWDFPGHGFGLSIARELVGLFGGPLHLKQREGGGLAATVEFPASSGLLKPSQRCVAATFLGANGPALRKFAGLVQFETADGLRGLRKYAAWAR